MNDNHPRPATPSHRCRTRHLGLALVSLLVWAQPVTAAAPHRQLTQFEPYLDKTWVAIVNPEKGTRDVARWERILGGQAIRMTHSVADGAYGGETIVMWDRAAEELVYTYFTTAGFFTRGSMSFQEDGSLTSAEAVHGHEDGITKVESIQSLLPDGQMQVRTRMLRNGVWEDRAEVLYRVDPTAKIILP